MGQQEPFNQFCQEGCVLPRAEKKIHHPQSEQTCWLQAEPPISEIIVTAFRPVAAYIMSNERNFFSFDTHQRKRGKYSVNMAVERGAAPCIPLVGWMSRAFTKD
ncbi:hypothetical protein AD937_07535 [Gluconobacter japonicus]|nr:hypothetical protein AD937_07535 [Gluconobacter japonicus]